jgi:hypothetical protein
MEQQEIQERNKQIALMLGGVYDTDMTKYWFYLPKGIKWSGIFAPTTSDLSFHSDWNWLMEAVEFIENLDLSEFNYHVGKMTLFRLNKDVLKKMPITSKKESIFIEVSDFAKQLNNKEL